MSTARYPRWALCLWLALAGILLWTAAFANEAAPCRTEEDAGNSFRICEFDLRDYALRLFWRDKRGEPYGSLNGLLASLGHDGAPVFAMNAGMYTPERAPVGLYVEQGLQLRPASLANGSGNFNLKPNGVFYVGGQEAGVLETGDFLRRRLKPDFATQSGPMLVIDGRLHPKFDPNSDSRKIRNGVGVRDGHIAVFAISDDPVTFSEFAELFRSRLDCRNALFLDGSISSLYAPSLDDAGSYLPAGPIVAAFRRADSPK